MCDTCIGPFGLNKEGKNFFKQVKLVAYLKDQRDVYRRKAIYYSFPLFDEIARRIKLSRKDEEPLKL